MKKSIIGALTATMLSGAAYAQDVKVGVLLGFTGPIESLTPPMAASAELALKEASDSGAFLGGKTIEAVRGDSTCGDAAAATAAAERMVTSDNVSAIMGADCSGVTIAVINNVAVPNGLVMISPSATSPALTTIDDKGNFFRVTPSDARQGQVLADIVTGKGIKSVAVTYTNNDYGKGVAESFGDAFAAAGGKVEISAAHEDGKADYSAEVAALAASGAEHLMIFGYVDGGGKGVMQTALDTGAFDSFFGSDGMVGDSLIEALGDGANGLITTLPGGESEGAAPGGESEGAAMFAELADAAGVKATGPFIPESYDAGAIIALAMQAAGSADRAALKAEVMDVVNAPGEKILPGEIAKGLKILVDGGDIDYVGATDVEFSDVGEADGSYKEQVIRDGKYELVKFH
jgi:branched-chain amino acid transport system substrate-binding protein